MRPVVAFRFDVDSIRCLEEGIPRLHAVAQEVDARFTFFVNMGYSFNWSHNLRHFGKKLLNRRRTVPAEPGGQRPQSLPTSAKLGRTGVVRTILQNPRLGFRYRTTLDHLHDAGHELGLHGGMDHVIWQRSLRELSQRDLADLFEPALETFTDWWGAPAGFASPGFQYDCRVLRMMDTYDFTYGSDMAGTHPFRPTDDQGNAFQHYQVPVNIAGTGNVPIIEESLARELPSSEIVERCVEALRARKFSLLYGHPYVEGVRSEILRAVIQEVKETHDIVTVGEYLNRWRDQHAG